MPVLQQKTQPEHMLQNKKSAKTKRESSSLKVKDFVSGVSPKGKWDKTVKREPRVKSAARNTQACFTAKGTRTPTKRTPSLRKVKALPAATELHKKMRQPRVKSRQSPGPEAMTVSCMPVRIKFKRCNTTIETYAFMDSATFCSERLMRRFGLHGKKTQVPLRTPVSTMTTRPSCQTC